MLTPLELATGQVFGTDSAIADLPAAPSELAPRAALEAAVLPALQRPPCVVSFSGGRDSSLVLAVAAAVARREGLPPPVPATLRFVAFQRADESPWQELVLRHLNLAERVSVDIVTELDLVGPLAARVLRKHGVLWPLNIYVQEALISQATGGAFLTGMAGDLVFSGSKWMATNELLSGRREARLRDALQLGLAFAPPWTKRLVLRRRLRPVGWLRPASQGAWREAAAAYHASGPRRWDRWIGHVARSRSLRVTMTSMQALASDANTMLVQPLEDPLFLAALAKAGGSLGIGDRTAIMRRLFAGLLPDQLLSRPDKAVFADGFVGQATAEFARSWRGEGIDHGVVDGERLRAAWNPDRFDLRAGLLLQSAWLQQQQGRDA